MQTYNGKPVFTTALALHVNNVAQPVKTAQYDEDVLSRIELVLELRETLLHNSVVIANQAAKLRRERGWKVTTIKGCNKKNLFIYIEGNNGIYVIFETPLTVLTPRDHDNFRHRHGYALLQAIEAIRLDTMMAKTIEPEPVAIEATGPVIEEPYKPVGLFERFFTWLSKKT
jgi:tRNA(Phe) wybutosine-synthesizing methylase Tyw3